MVGKLTEQLKPFSEVAKGPENKRRGITSGQRNIHTSIHRFMAIHYTNHPPPLSLVKTHRPAQSY
jgi:hypothetical protein